MNTITQTLNLIKPAAADFGGLSPTRALTVSVRTGRRSYQHKDTFTLGCELQETLSRYEDRARLTGTEQALWPFAAELRSALEGFGVRHIKVERPLASWAGVPRGQCDLFLFGGLRQRGIVEVKVVDELPVIPRPKNFVQLGGYLWNAAREDQFERWWGCVAYVSFAERKIRLFTYRDIRPLVVRSAELLRAAA